MIVTKKKTREIKDFTVHHSRFLPVPYYVIAVLCTNFVNGFATEALLSLHTVQDGKIISDRNNKNSNEIKRANIKMLPINLKS